MTTVLYSTTKEDLTKAADLLGAGGLVAFPTETVYGLGADAFDPNAAKKAYAAKGRPSDNPLIVHIAEFDDLKRLVPENQITEVVKKLADAFWPGPFTMVLPKLDAVPSETTGGLSTVAVRMPDSMDTLFFIKASKTLVAGPSANTSGLPSPTTWKHVADDLSGKIDAIICGDAASGGIESTVLDVASMKILRPGLITPEMIAAATGLEVSYDKALYSKPSDDPNFHPMAPGMKYKHYSPKAEMYLVEGDIEIAKQKFAGREIAVVDLNPKTFFADLRKADSDGVDIILAKKLSDDSSLSFSIMNRALKAAGYKII